MNRTNRTAFTALALLAGSGCSYLTVEAGQVGVVWTPSGVTDKVYPEGQYAVGFFDRPTLYDARSQEREEKLDVLAVNGLRIGLDTSVRYHIVPEEATKLDHEMGVHFYSILVGPSLRSQARRVVGRYQPEEIYSTKRELIEREIREGLEKAITGRHLVLEAVLIRNVTLPDQIQAAINDKLDAEQKSLKMKFILEQAKQEQERQTLEATAASARSKIQAQAEADAKRIAAQATDDYQRLIQMHLNETVLKWNQIEAMKALATSANAKVILLGEGKGSIILDTK